MDQSNQDQQEEKDISLSGTIDTVVYRNDNTGFAVIELDSDGELVTATGEMFGVTAGEDLVLWGRYTNHPTYGLQFKVKACERILPSSATAIRKYLSAGAVQGVGPKTARRLVDAFGADTLEVIAHDPGKMTAIQGISDRKAQEISEEFRKIYGVRETVSKLTALGFETADALLLHSAWTEGCVQIIENNPYVVCGYPTFKEFEFADAIAKNAGMPPDHPDRVRAGIVHVLRHNLNNGHTCLPSGKLVDTAAAFLGLEHDTAEIELYNAVEDSMLRADRIGGEERIFLKDMFRAERMIASRLHLLKSLEFGSVSEADAMIDKFEELHKIHYEELQRRAIELSLTSGIVVITGGPGTGKTTTVNAIIGLCELNGDEVALCAPTGRAAKRLTELTGRDARTIHRLLEVQVQKNDEVRFVHDESNPLRYDAVIVDEMSMVDVSLFESLLRGLKPQCRLILVGDYHQLPSVGAGNLLRDIIESGAFETVEFSRIFRQAANSLIVVSAHHIVGGDMPDLSVRDNDFFFLPVSREEGAGLVTSLVSKRLPKAYRIDPLTDIQVLTPSRMGMLGMYNLNEALRDGVNPRAPEKGEITVMGQLYREGDKVMQTKNNYSVEWRKQNGERGQGAFNGDIGFIEKVDRRNQTIQVLYDDRYITYAFDQARQIEPAYAVTVHKSQGSEFHAVVLALGDFPKKLSYRNLLYTAVTRARKLLVIVGDKSAIEAMVANDRRMLRYTGLKEYLTRPPQD